MRGLLMIAALVFSAAAVEVAAQRPAIIKHERIVSEYREAAPLVWRHEVYALAPDLEGWEPTDLVSSDLRLETVHRR